MKLHMIINDSVSKKYFRKCLTIFEIFENYFFKNFPLYGMTNASIFGHVMVHDMVDEQE